MSSCCVKRLWICNGQAETVGLNHSWGVQVLIIRETKGDNPKHSAEFEIDPGVCYLLFCML